MKSRFFCHPLDWHNLPDTGSAPQHLFSVPIGSDAQKFIRLKVTVP